MGAFSAGGRSGLGGERGGRGGESTGDAFLDFGERA